MKIATLIGTRPEVIRLSRIIATLDKYMNQTLIHTGQNYDYELNEIFFEDLEIRKPDYFLNAAGGTAAETIGSIITESDKVLRKIKPDAFLVLGDTNSCLAALSAKRLQIPVYHMEAGNRCYDERVPEEINRRVVDHISDINLPYSQISRQYLLAEGFPADRVIVTGSPMFEVLSYYRPKIESSMVLERLHLNPREYFLISCHREENIDSELRFRDFFNILNRLAEEYSRRIIVTTHPRTRLHLDNKDLEFNGLIEFHKPFAFSDYARLQLNAIAVLSDSGTITEESSILDLPALNIREAHERPEGMEEGTVMMVGLDWERVHQGLRILEDRSFDGRRSPRMVSDYDVANVSEKILRIIVSYTDYVNRRVWYKE